MAPKRPRIRRGAAPGPCPNPCHCPHHASGDEDPCPHCRDAPEPGSPETCFCYLISCTEDDERGLATDEMGEERISARIGYCPLHAAAPETARRMAEVIAALRAVEWCCSGDICPLCGAWKRRRVHGPGCAIGSALARTAPAKKGGG